MCPAAAHINHTQRVTTCQTRLETEQVQFHYTLPHSYRSGEISGKGNVGVCVFCYRLHKTEQFHPRTSPEWPDSRGEFCSYRAHLGLRVHGNKAGWVLSCCDTNSGAGSTVSWEAEKKPWTPAVSRSPPAGWLYHCSVKFHSCFSGVIKIIPKQQTRADVKWRLIKL